MGQKNLRASRHTESLDGLSSFQEKHAKIKTTVLKPPQVGKSSRLRRLREQ